MDEAGVGTPHVKVEGKMQARGYVQDSMCNVQKSTCTALLHGGGSRHRMSKEALPPGDGKLHDLLRSIPTLAMGCRVVGIKHPCYVPLHDGLDSKARARTSPWCTWLVLRKQLVQPWGSFSAQTWP